MSSETVTLELTYFVTVNNEDAVARCFTQDWRDRFYEFKDREHVLEYFALYLGAYSTQLSHMDGWADLPDDAVVVREL